MMNFSQLTKREKMLSAAVAGVLLVLVNIFAVSFLVKKQAGLRADYATKSTEWKMLQVILAEQSLWEKRSAWLDAKQPKLANESSDRVEFFGDVQKVAEQFEVTLENQVFGNLTKTPFYQSLPVTLETTSSWDSLIKFLHGLQQPEKFIVLETVDVQIEATDPSKMRGKFRIATWYAPATK